MVFFDVYPEVPRRRSSPLFRSPKLLLRPSFVFMNLQHPFPATPFLSHSYEKHPGWRVQKRISGESHKVKALKISISTNCARAPSHSGLPKKGTKRLVNYPGLSHRHASSSLPGSMPAGPLRYWAHGARIRAGAETVPPIPVSKAVERTSGIDQ